MKLYAKLITENETQKTWSSVPDYYKKEDGWYEIERESEENEYLEYNSKLDIIEIKQRIKTPEQLAVEQEAKDKADYITAMPDLVKSLEAEIISLKGKVEALETARGVAK